jgi:hypothetical protein
MERGRKGQLYIEPPRQYLSVLKPISREVKSAPARRLAEFWRIQLLQGRMPDF